MPVTHIRATRFGRPLPDGGTIGVPAPSGPYFNASDILRCQEWWEERGYRVKIGDPGSGIGTTTSPAPPSAAAPT